MHRHCTHATSHSPPRRDHSLRRNVGKCVIYASNHPLFHCSLPALCLQLWKINLLIEVHSCWRHANAFTPIVLWSCLQAINGVCFAACAPTPTLLHTWRSDKKQIGVSVVQTTRRQRNALISELISMDGAENNRLFCRMLFLFAMLG